MSRETTFFGITELFDFRTNPRLSRGLSFYG